MKQVKLTILRGDQWHTYMVPFSMGMKLIDALHYIQEHVEPTLAFRSSCESAVCGSCAMQINGRNALACSYDIPPKGVLKIAPLKGFEVIRDLIVDLTPFYEGLKKIPVSEVVESLQTPDDRQKLDGYYECIHCAACSSSCSVFNRDDCFEGPAFMMQAWLELSDSRKKGFTEVVTQVIESGLWDCVLFMSCVKACAKGLNPTEAIINIRNSMGDL